MRVLRSFGFSSGTAGAISDSRFFRVLFAGPAAAAAAAEAAAALAAAADGGPAEGCPWTLMVDPSVAGDCGGVVKSADELDAPPASSAFPAAMLRTHPKGEAGRARPLSFSFSGTRESRDKIEIILAAR